MVVSTVMQRCFAMFQRAVWLLILWPVLVRAADLDALPPAPPPPSDFDVRFPTYGLALDNPPGWTHLPEESPENIARWAVLDAKTRQPQAILGVYVGRSGDGLIAYAQNQVRTTGGAITGELRIDGERALLVTADGTATIIAKHAGLFYLVVLRQSAGHQEKVFGDLADSLRWRPMESVAQHLDLGPPREALGGSVMVQVPACLRPYAGEDTPTALHMVATDILNRREFVVLMQPGNVGANVTLEEARKSMLDGWNQKLNPKTPLVWKVDAAHPGCALTNMVRLPVAVNGQPGFMAFQFGLVIEDKRAVLLSFNVRNPQENEVDAYDEVATSIAQSVKFKAAATKP